MRFDTATIIYYMVCILLRMFVFPVPFGWVDVSFVAIGSMLIGIKLGSVPSPPNKAE